MGFEYSKQLTGAFKRLPCDMYSAIWWPGGRCHLYFTAPEASARLKSTCFTFYRANPSKKKNNETWVNLLNEALTKSTMQILMYSCIHLQ